MTFYRTLHTENFETLNEYLPFFVDKFGAIYNTDYFNEEELKKLGGITIEIFIITNIKTIKTNFVNIFKDIELLNGEDLIHCYEFKILVLCNKQVSFCGI